MCFNLPWFKSFIQSVCYFPTHGSRRYWSWRRWMLCFQLWERFRKRSECRLSISFVSWGNAETNECGSPLSSRITAPGEGEGLLDGRSLVFRGPVSPLRRERASLLFVPGNVGAGDGGAVGPASSGSREGATSLRGDAPLLSLQRFV